MVYTKGHEEDEKLHKAYHQGALHGFKFQVGTAELQDPFSHQQQTAAAAAAAATSAEELAPSASHPTEDLCASLIV